MKTFSKGGIHPDPSKLTAGMPIEGVRTPSVVRLLLSQHIGVPAKCIVKPKQVVAAGEKIAEAGGFVSAAVHTPVAGVVRKIELVRDGQGLWKEAVVIDAAESPESPSTLCFDESSPVRNEADIAALSAQEIIDIVGEAGIVGLGGASFPTRVKLSIPEGKSADVFVINGAECEPYLTCDDALMRAWPDRILRGVALLMRAAGTKKAVVGIESNKPEAIKAMKSAARKFEGIEVETLKTAYPQGSEKQLIYALTGRTVPAGGLPVDAGVVVDNVATAFAVDRAVRFGEPLTKRVATVTGPAVTRPGNYIVCAGMSAGELMEHAGGVPENTGKVIAGGPMMGRAMSCTDSPLVKSSGGILVLPEDMSRRGEERACMRCGGCLNAGPMGLEPYLLQTLGEFGKAEEARGHGVLNCLECGSCSYVCPSHRPVLDYIRLAKQMVRTLPRK